MGEVAGRLDDQLEQAGLGLPGSDTELLDLSKGRYVTDSVGNVIGVAR